jgi:hypothetical protein
LSLLDANWSKSLNIKPITAIFMDFEANLQVFLNTFKQLSSTEDMSTHGLGFSDITNGSRDHISAKREMLADLIAYSLALVEFA